MQDRYSSGKSPVKCYSYVSWKVDICMHMYIYIYIIQPMCVCRCSCVSSLYIDASLHIQLLSPAYLTYKGILHRLMNELSINGYESYVIFVMPPPLGAGGNMFSGCPSVRPSVRPSEAWNTLFWPVHGSVGPPDQPWPFYGMSVCPSVRPSVQRGFRAFAWEPMEGIAWNSPCWCILTIFRTDKFMAMVCWFF